MVPLLGFLLIGLVATYIAIPLVARRGSGLHRAGPDVDLIARRNTLYREIADLDFDHKAGKVDEGDYDAQRHQYVDEAALVLRDLDEQSAVASRRAADLTELDAQIEAEIRGLRRQEGGAR